MELPSLNIGELQAKVPIIQGAMGIGVSLSNLAAAVANEGGVGVISGVQIGFDEPDFKENTESANVRALKNHIKKAKQLSHDGLLGVNLMTVISNYKEMAKAAVEEKIDLIFSGAGLPKNLPEMVKGSKTKISPIVSSGKAASLIAKIWDKKYDYTPDMVVVEGPKAGGHLGFHVDQLQQNHMPSLDKIVMEVIEVLKPYAKKYNKSIPVIAAGGVFTGHDISRAIEMGASGVQMGTRFVATEECDANLKFKEAYINSVQNSIQLIKSPVGLPGRAINNNFIKKLETEKVPIKNCYNCLKACKPKEADYCISNALIDSVQGNVDDGLIFAGSNAYRINKMTTVKELMSELAAEAAVPNEIRSATY
ncbi:NAD(P)H-dependent flavin oxidoreductase [Natranaerofaba carboxydovora]|uniref:NAD(P)H-dependent flavin oxidoreductase n=1 Tax=Natranaerofaba carboxydovora TaxID=2742683 RepID=UPI001F141E41|nr:nitronate monooxygenase family protein [Natranaerofaba carboxydovora]UMZ72512.1 Nitronate monooxygenase [Natranaerofaba carboxydovora]